MAKSSPVSVLKAYWFPLILFASSMFYQLLILPRSYPPSHYDVLGIKRYSSMEQVTETYEKFSSKWYYSDEWLHEDQNIVPPHRDEEVTRERNECLKRYFEDITKRTKVITEFGKFSGYVETFSEYDSIHNRWHMDPYTWWCAYGAYTPSL